MDVMLIIAPIIHLQVAFYRNVVDITFKSMFSIYKQLCFPDTIEIIGSSHIIVRPDGKANLSPCRKMRSEFMGTKSEHLIATSAAERAFTRSRTGHKTVCLRFGMIS